ncbi:unnamed protein product, partial [Gulo gulo]
GLSRDWPGRRRRRAGRPREISAGAAPGPGGLQAPARAPMGTSLLPDQLVLLLEHLLEQKSLTARTLHSLEKTYHLPQQDAEVRHRWCELIVKHKYTKAYKDVERFLQEDQVGKCVHKQHGLRTCGHVISLPSSMCLCAPQAMGVYLYGELMLGEDVRQQQVARRCFELTKEQMDRSSAEVVAEMLL